MTRGPGDPATPGRAGRTVPAGPGPRLAAPLRAATRHFRRCWPGVLLSALAAGLAWMAAQQLLHHPRPIFAAGAAVVCLSPGVSSRGGQAVGMLTGIVIGLGVGGAAMLLPVPAGAPLIVAATAAAMLLAAAFGLSAVMLIQAGISAILVLEAGPASGWGRLGDAVVGGALGLVVSQVLFSPNPTRLVAEASHDVLDALAAGLDLGADAVARRDPGLSRQAVARLVTAHDALARLAGAVSAAHGVLRWTLRGRFAPAGTQDRITRHGELCAQACAAALLLGAEVEAALRQPPPAFPALGRRIRQLADLCRDRAGGHGGRTHPPIAREAEPPGPPCGWALCTALSDRLASRLDDLACSLAALNAAGRRPTS